MAESTIRAALVSELKDVSGIGTVVDRVGYADKWAASNPDAPLVVVAPVGGWNTTYRGIGGAVNVPINYRIRVYVPFNFERDSDAQASALADAIINQLRDNTRLNASCAHCGPPQVMANDSAVYQMEGGCVVHYMTISFPATDWRQPQS